MSRAGIRQAAARLLTLTAALAAGAAWSQPALRDGDIVLLRHAQAPGTGDPPGMRLEDCTTQRNLDETGRLQARSIGARLRAQGVHVTAVVTSEWCRARETAALAFPDVPAHADSAFNNFFQDRSREAVQTARARATLLRWRGPGVMVVTTHQFNITALTGLSPGSGEGVVVRPRQGGLDVVGPLRTGEP